MPLPTMLLLYWFWLTEICMCHKPRPTRDKMCDLQIALQWRSYCRFSIVPVLYTQDTFTPFFNFEVGHFDHHFFFLSFGAAMKGSQFTQLYCNIWLLSFTTCFLSGRGRLLNSRKCRLFCMHIHHSTRCLFEQWTPVGSSEAAVSGFCFSILLRYSCKNWL